MGAAHGKKKEYSLQPTFPNGSGKHVVNGSASMYSEIQRSDLRGLSVESKPELQRVLEHRRRNQLLRQKKEEEEAKKLQSPFEQELLKRQQRLDQLERGQEKHEEHAPEFIKVKENLRRTSTLTGKRK